MQVYETMDNHTRADMIAGLLDSLSISIFLIEAGNRVIFANVAGDAMLADGTYVHSVMGVSNEYRTIGLPSALADAVERVARGDCASGIGVSLVGANGKQSAAYVLPIAGNALRSADNRTCCGVFIAQQGAEQPMAIQVLRSMFGLTCSEARVAGMIAKGHGPQAIAATLGIKINTVRSHLQSTFSKTNVSDQTGLGGLVNGLIAPINHQ
jgi:DNA-binding CsgD family transcriptional regulator